MAKLIKLNDNDNINDSITFHNFYYFGIIENFFSYHKDSQLSKFNGNFSNGLHKAKNINTNIVVKKTTLNGSNSMETEKNISKENNNIFYPNLLMKKKKLYYLSSNDNNLMMTSSQFSQESTNSTTPTTTLLPSISTTSITTATSNLSDSFNYEANGRAKSNDTNLGNYTNLFKYVGKSSR